MKKLILLSVIAVCWPLGLFAQDDIYFVPTREMEEQTAREYGMPRDTYYIGSTRSIDDYNRLRSSYVVLDSLANDSIDFDAIVGVYPDSVYLSEPDDYRYTRRMNRFDGYEPSSEYWAGYYAGRNSWHSPWYYGWYNYPWYNSYYSWYDPWYDPYYYGGWYSPWYGSYYGYYGWRNAWYGGWYGGWYGPGRIFVSSGRPIGTRNHGTVAHRGAGSITSGVRNIGNGTFGGAPQGTRNRGSVTYGTGTFGGSRIGTRTNTNTTRTNTYTPRTETYTPRTNTTTTTNSYGNFGGARTGGGSVGGGTRSGGGGGGGHFGRH